MSMNGNQLSATKLYPHPFSKEYWCQAASEFKKTKVLIFAALMIALRVVLKSFGIPVGLDLKINIAFFINAYGAMVFGPVVAIVGAAISDTLGCLLNPAGGYFFPFIFVEIAGSLIFALFLYRAEISCSRLILSRFCIDFFVNIVLNTPIMWMYYTLILGKYYALIDLPRIIKNLCMFPLESLLLILFMRAVLPQTKRLGFVHSGVEKLKFNKKNVTLLVVLFLVGVVAVSGYSIYTYNTKSLSAGYSAQERAERNGAMTAIVEENNAQLEEQTVVAIVESAFPKFRDPNVTYNVAVYTVNQEAFDAKVAESEGTEYPYGMETVMGYSKTPATKDEALVKVGYATIVVDKKTDAVVSYEDDFE